MTTMLRLANSQLPKRCLQTLAPTSGVVFDKKLRVQHMDRAAIAKDAQLYDYVREQVVLDICDRFDDIIIEGEKKLNIFNLGSCSNLIISGINQQKVNTFIQGDISRRCIERSKQLNQTKSIEFPIDYIECDEESVPLKTKSIDLAISCLDLHWVNDLVKCFKGIHAILSDNRPFLGCMFGGETLTELRTSLQLAEMERLGGFSSHIAPKTTGQDIGRVLQTSGFRLITVDITDVRIRYPSMFELMFDLQGMGESNASVIGSKHMNREVLLAASSIYQNLYGKGDDIKAGVPATFQVLHFIGWKNPTKATPMK